jgi:hypothetical protein
MGLVAFAAGAALVAAAAGWLATEPGTVQAPRWVIGCAGAMFLAGSLVPLGLTFGFPAWLNRIVGLTVGLGLALVLNWVAFFPGARHFSTTVSVPGLHFGAASGETSGRIMFGAMALLADALVLGGLWRQLRRTRAPVQRPPGG